MVGSWTQRSQARVHGTAFDVTCVLNLPLFALYTCGSCGVYGFNTFCGSTKRVESKQYAVEQIACKIRLQKRMKRNPKKKGNPLGNAAPSWHAALRFASQSGPRRQLCLLISRLLWVSSDFQQISAFSECFGAGINARSGDWTLGDTEHALEAKAPLQAGSWAILAPKRTLKSGFLHFYIGKSCIFAVFWRFSPFSSCFMAGIDAGRRHSCEPSPRIFFSRKKVVTKKFLGSRY